MVCFVSEIQVETNFLAPFNNDSIEISINIGSISLCCQNELVSLMNICLQNFSCYFHNYTKQSTIYLIINGQLGSLCLYDLLIVNQLYNRQLYTMNEKAFVFSFTTEHSYSEVFNNEFPCQPRFHLQMTSIRYIHIQSFLFSFMTFFNRFWHNQDIYYRLETLFTKVFVSNILNALNQILWNIEIENIILMLPANILDKTMLIFEIDYFNIKNIFHHQNQTNPSNILRKEIKNLCTEVFQVDLITIDMENIDSYSAHYCLPDEKALTSNSYAICEFIRSHDQLSSLIRQRFNLNMKIEHSFDKFLINTPSTYKIKMNLSIIDILISINHYRLIQNILCFNLLPESNIMILNIFNSFIFNKNNLYTNISVVIEIEQIGLEIFEFDIERLSFNQYRSLGYSGLTKVQILLNQEYNRCQSLDLFASLIHLRNTQVQNGNMIHPVSTPFASNQLECRLLKTAVTKECIIMIKSLRFLLVVDWLLKLNEYLNLLFEQRSTINCHISTLSFDIKFNLNQFEIVLVPTIQDPYTNAFGYSSTIDFRYTKRNPFIECFINDFRLFTCQIGSIDETAVFIVEPTDFSFSVQRSIEKADEQCLEFHIPVINLHLNYSDLRMILFLFDLIFKQLSQANIRNPILTYMDKIFMPSFKASKSHNYGFLHMNFLKFMCNEICLCFIDDCFAINIPLFNINIKSFNLQTIENNHLCRTDQSEFQFTMFSYNRFQSGFEPLIELCQLRMIFSRSPASTSLFICSNEILNLNFTKAMYLLCSTIKKNWLIDYYKSKDDDTATIPNKKIGFRHVKSSDSYLFKNLIGYRTNFRTWITSEQKYSSYEHVVNNNQTIPFCFPNCSSGLSTDSCDYTRERTQTNSVIASLLQTDRRLLISIEGWKSLQPISIDRVGKFFRLAIPTENSQFYKPILVMIDISIADSSIRQITIKSSIEIRNQLLTAMDIRLECNVNLSYEFCLEPKKTFSIPIQFCSGLKQIQVRPNNFALRYCDEPIYWSDIENYPMKTIQNDSNR